MAVFPKYGLDEIADLTLVQYSALHAVGAQILEAKAKAMSL